MAKDTVNYNLNVSTKISNIIEDISNSENISKTEVFRRSLAVYAYLYKEHKAESKVQVVDKNGDIKEIIFQ